MSEICPRCNKAVYHAERVLGGGKGWHKRCFKCPECSKRLDSANMAMHGTNAYCKSCYGRLYGPKGYGFGQGAGALSMDAGKPKEQTPPQFGGAVASNGGGSSFGGGGGARPKFCGDCGAKAAGGKFCQECGAAQPDSGSSTPVSSSGPPPVPASAKPSHVPRKFGGSVGGGGGFKKPMGGAANRDACGRCGKTVYHAEKVMGGGQAWHRACFKCTSCKRKLDSSTLREHENEIFCNSCHGAHFGPKGYGFGGGAGALSRTQ